MFLSKNCAVTSLLWRCSLFFVDQNVNNCCLFVVTPWFCSLLTPSKACTIFSPAENRSCLPSSRDRNRTVLFCCLLLFILFHKVSDFKIMWSYDRNRIWIRDVLQQNLLLCSLTQMTSTACSSLSATNTPPESNVVCPLPFLTPEKNLKSSHKTHTQKGMQFCGVKLLLFLFIELASEQQEKGSESQHSSPTTTGYH